MPDMSRLRKLWPKLLDSRECLSTAHHGTGPGPSQQTKPLFRPNAQRESTKEGPRRAAFHRHVPIQAVPTLSVVEFESGPF